MIDTRKGALLVAAVVVVFHALPAYPTAPNETSRWNSPKDRKGCNNCYNYATNQPNSSFAQPGWAGGIMNSSPYTCGGLLAGAEADGLSFAGQTLDEGRERCPEDCCLVALVNSGFDFHWYRRDDDGTWSHKPGASDATNLDAGGQLILDPSGANHNYGGAAEGGRNYDNFCGFMCVCRDEIENLKGKKTSQSVPPEWYGECTFPCVENAPGCVPPFVAPPYGHPSCCCSCRVRILDVDVYECSDLR